MLGLLRNPPFCMVVSGAGETGIAVPVVAGWSAFVSIIALCMSDFMAAVLAFTFWLRNIGMAIAAMIARMATTTSSSTREKPLLLNLRLFFSACNVSMFFSECVQFFVL